MAGFMAGFGQAMSQLPTALQNRQEMDIKRLAQARQAKLDEQKATGDLIAGLSTALETTPEEAIPNRLGLFFSQIEQTTGKKINSAVKSEFLRDPQGAVKSMAQVYGDTGGFDQAKLGDVLSNPQAFAGIYDALNKRKVGEKAAAEFTTGLSGGAQGGSTSAPQNDLQRLDSRIQALTSTAAKLDPASPGFKERLGFLEKTMTELNKQRELTITNAYMAAARRNGVSDPASASPAIQQAIQADVIRQLGLTEQSQTAGRTAATPVPFEAASAVGLPVGTTYGQIGSGGAPSQPAAGGQAPLGIRNNNPGNLRPVGSSTGFQQFNTMQEGMAALDANLQSYGQKGRDTIRKVISAWAPPSENDTEAYIATVSKRLGIPPDAQLDMNNPLTRQVLGSAIALHENGSRVLLAQNQGRGQQGGRSLVPPTPAESAQQREMAVGVAQEYRENLKKSTKAAARQANAERLSTLLDQVDTGTFAGSILQIQKAAASLGFQVPESATAAEAARSLSLAMAMEMRDPSEGAGSPGAISNYETQTFQAMIPSIDKLPGANKLIADAYIKQQKRAQEITKLQREYVQSNGKVDDGIYEIAEKYREKNPLFTPEEVNKVLKGTSKSDKKGPVQAAVEPFSDAAKEKRYQEWKRSQGK